MSEWRMDPARWRELVPLVQMVYNQAPAPSLGNIPPVKVMTGIEPMSPLALLQQPGSAEPITMEALMDIKKLEFAKFQAALAELHSEAAQAADKKRAASRARNSKAQMAQFEPGDFVLYMDVWNATPAKLSVRWKGPAQVIKATSPWVFEIQNLITGVVKEAHASRLKFYADQDLNVDHELLAHVAHNDQGHVVESFGDCRWNPQTKAYEVQVKWRGLDDVEKSWEPATNLMEDLPVAFAKHLSTCSNDSVVRAMQQAYSWPSSEGGSMAFKKPSRRRPANKDVDTTSTTSRLAEGDPSQQSDS